VNQCVVARRRDRLFLSGRSDVVAEHMQIGEVAQATGLSLRTIRHYEEVGLVLPTARSKGGFRLYTEDDVARLRLVRAMKPLEFTLEEMRDLLRVLDGLDADEEVEGSREVLVDRLAMYRMAAVGRVRALREQLAVAEAFADRLREEIDRHGGAPRAPMARARAARVSEEGR
jgi:MerR family copper efflux transcriptional regulator